MPKAAERLSGDIMHDLFGLELVQASGLKSRGSSPVRRFKETQTAGMLE